MLNLAIAKGRNQSRNSQWCDPQSGDPSARTTRSGCALSARKAQPNQLKFSGHLNTNTVGIRKEIFQSTYALEEPEDEVLPPHTRANEGSTSHHGQEKAKPSGTAGYQKSKQEQRGAGLRWAGSWYAGPWWTPWLMRRRELPFPFSERLEARRARARAAGAGRANPSWTCGCERARRRGREEGFVPLS